MSTLEAVDHLLLGREFETSAKLSGVASVLFVVTFLLRLPAVFGPLPGGGELLDSVVFTGALVLAAGGAYYNDGLLVSIALAASLTLGFYLPYAFSRILRPHHSALAAIGLGAGYALLFGIVGFILGSGGRRVIGRLRE